MLIGAAGSQAVSFLRMGEFNRHPRRKSYKPANEVSPKGTRTGLWAQ